MGRNRSLTSRSIDYYEAGPIVERRTERATNNHIYSPHPPKSMVKFELSTANFLERQNFLDSTISWDRSVGGVEGGMEGRRGGGKGRLNDEIKAGTYPRFRATSAELYGL